MYMISGELISASDSAHLQPGPEEDDNNSPSDVYEIVKVTESEILSLDVDPTAVPEHKVVLLDPWWEAEYMGVAVGALVTVILILIAVIIFIMYKNHSSRPDASDPEYCYQQSHMPKSGPLGAQTWEEKPFPGSPRKLPPTPGDNHYGVSSMEYRSPLLYTNPRQQQPLPHQQQQYAVANWGSLFPTPPGTLAGGRGSPVVNHYAETDLICGRGKLERPSGAQYFL